MATTRINKAATVDGQVNQQPEVTTANETSDFVFPGRAPENAELAVRQPGGQVSTNTGNGGIDEIDFNLEAIGKTVKFDDKPNAQQLEFYTGEMDIAYGAPNLSIDAMLADLTLNVSHAAAGSRLGKLDILQNGFEVKIKETKIKRLAVELQTQETKLAGDLADLSGAQSDTKRKFATAKHKKFQKDVQGKKEEFERIELVSNTVRAGAKAQKSYGRARSYVIDNTMPGFEGLGNQQGEQTNG